MTGDAINIDGITMELQNFLELNPLYESITFPLTQAKDVRIILQDMHISCLTRIIWYVLFLFNDKYAHLITCTYS